MKSKLILVEGLPGSGKSTTAQLIYDVLIEKKVDAKLFLEGNLNHPADYDGVAFYTENEFEGLLASCTPELKAKLLESVREHKGQYFLPYQKLIQEGEVEIPEDVSRSMYSHDIYELPLNVSQPLILDKWRQFVAHALNSECVFIFECCFIQNPVTLGMIKHDAATIEVIDQVRILAEIIAPLNPLLVYVEQSNLDFSFRKAVQERPTEWSHGFIHYYTNQGYGKARGYTGIDGTLNVLQARSDVENEIFEKLTLCKVRINNSSFELRRHRDQLAVVIKTRFASRPPIEGTKSLTYT